MRRVMSSSATRSVHASRGGAGGVPETVARGEPSAGSLAESIGNTPRGSGEGPGWDGKRCSRACARVTAERTGWMWLLQEETSGLAGGASAIVFGDVEAFARGTGAANPIPSAAPAVDPTAPPADARGKGQPPEPPPPPPLQLPQVLP